MLFRSARVEPDAVVTNAGERVPLDALVFATGFQAGRMLWPMEVKGLGGVSVRELWGDDNPRAYMGMAVPKEYGGMDASIFDTVLVLGDLVGYGPDEIAADIVARIVSISS